MGGGMMGGGMMGGGMMGAKSNAMGCVLLCYQNLRLAQKKLLGL